MKTLIVASCLIASYSLPLAAASIAAEKVQFNNKKVIVTPGDQALEAPNEVTLPFDIIVRTNGTFMVKGGKARQLEEGEILDQDGMLIKPDGSITPVMDHVTLNRGKVILMKDGEPTEPSAAIELGNGTSVSPDGKVSQDNGSPRQLLDGELFHSDGKTLPTRDTISLQNGKVVVQKDGSKLSVEPGRSITMNDGTKVLGDGTVIQFNGEKSTISEGQILTLEGVVRNQR